MISSLGHNMTLRGMYGTPRKLCTDTVRQLCRVAELLQPMNPIRLIAISTEGVDRPDGADPPRGRGERLVLWLLWLLLPPHADNLAVVDYLHRSARRRVGKRPPGPRPGSPASSDEPVERWAAPEESLSHSDPHEGSGCHTLSSARAKSLRRRVHHPQARTSPHVEFCAVRPSDMIDSEEKSEVAP